MVNGRTSEIAVRAAGEGAGSGARVSGWAPVLLFVAVVTLARIAYLVWLSPYNLIEDEAHYWEWSRRLGWSYYSKGPGVAWAIWLATRWSQAEWAVRLPAAVSAGLATDRKSTRLNSRH